eukprot:1478739-Prymnesium_polylepis.1
MQNDVARRVRAIGARLPSCPSWARRVGDGRAANGRRSRGVFHSLAWQTRWRHMASMWLLGAASQRQA